MNPRLPGPHPAPPTGLNLRSLTIRRFEGECYRTYEIGYEPIFFGRAGTKRFDDPRGEYGVLYAARDIYGSFIETFGQLRSHLISSSELKKKGLANLAVRRPLSLVDLAEPGALARIGADSRLFAGDYDVAQLWSRAFYECPLVRLDGILYPARLDQTRASLALFDRADGIEVIDSHCWYQDDEGAGKSLRAKLGEILDHYDFRLIETIARPQKKGPGRSAQGTLDLE